MLDGQIGSHNAQASGAGKPDDTHETMDVSGQYASIFFRMNRTSSSRTSVVDLTLVNALCFVVALVLLNRNPVDGAGRDEGTRVGERLFRYEGMQKVWSRPFHDRTTVCPDPSHLSRASQKTDDRRRSSPRLASAVLEVVANVGAYALRVVLCVEPLVAWLVDKEAVGRGFVEHVPGIESWVFGTDVILSMYRVFLSEGRQYGFLSVSSVG